MSQIAYQNPCKSCARAVYCNMESEDVIGCVNYQERVPHTNADRIRAMTDEELSKLIADYIDCTECQESNIGEPRCRGGQTCEEYWLEWLRGDAEE